MKPGVRISFVVSTTVRFEGRVVVFVGPEKIEVITPFSMRIEPFLITCSEVEDSSQAITVPPDSSVAALASDVPKERLRRVDRCIVVLSRRISIPIAT